MTIRRRLTIWYGAVLTVSLLLIGGSTYQEFAERARHLRKNKPPESALDASSEIVFRVGLPAIILGVAGAWWLTRRALQPLAALTKAAKEIDERTIDRSLPRTGNGDELDELAGVLNAMQARLGDSFRRIREFTLHASHELKTPLTVMQGELETALRERQLPAEERERLISQLDEVQRLSKIVNGLTLLTQADSGHVKLKKEIVQLDELVRDLHADTVILAEPGNITVQLTACDEAPIAGDAHRLRELLLNLADNSVKYNVQGGSIAMALRRAGPDVEFAISNTGPGIAKEQQARVFDRFYRGDPAHGTGVEGCGLGLSIAQWIAAAHGGAIQIESDPGRLTTATLRLPLASQPGA